MKNFKAILFALAITGVIAAGMFIIGTNALANPNSVPMSDSPQQAAAVSAATNSITSGSTSEQQQIAQLQALVNQYQEREKQYQAQLNTAAQAVNSTNAQLNQAAQELQQYQQLLIALQQRGIIQITNSGQILLPSNRGFGDDNRSPAFQ